MKKRFILIFAIYLGIGSILVPTALAEPSDNAIKAGCVMAQSTLNQIEKTDAALRINRGRIYNEIIDLLYAMNSRLASNKIAAAKLVEITAQYNDELTSFRSNYNSYDDKLNSAISYDCSNDPSGFYSKLNQARQGRKTMQQNVAELDQLHEDYSTEFATLKEKIDVNK